MQPNQIFSDTQSPEEHTSKDKNFSCSRSPFHACQYIAPPLAKKNFYPYSEIRAEFISPSAGKSLRKFVALPLCYMIGFIEGKIESSSDKCVIVDVGGIGYKIYISANIFKKLPKIGEKVKLYTHLHVREDILDLYGFLDKKELEFFELLISISGIGPKGALNILSVASIETLKKAISNEESSILTKVSGIGKKTAEKIILELKSKVTGGELLGDKAGADGDAIDALIGLGYKLHEAREVLKKIPEDFQDVGEKVREALKILGKK